MAAIRMFETSPGAWAYMYRVYGTVWEWRWPGSAYYYQIPREECARRILSHRKPGQITGLSRMALLVGKENGDNS